MKSESSKLEDKSSKLKAQRSKLEKIETDRRRMVG
jgi:hypothetical protein